MDYEKAYKEALEWMKSLYNGLHGATKEEAEKYFPELKEWEDERIRTILHSFINDIKGDLLHQYHLTKDEVMAWLEKQGEQTPSWSDEDEEYMSDVIAFLKDARDCRQNALDCIEWMKQLKERLS